VDRSQDWLKQAERDFKAAEASKLAGYHEWSAFEAQQSAEKAVKALVQHHHGASRGHSITALLEQMAGSISVPGAVLNAARELDQVYVTSRYPNGFAAGSPVDYFTDATSERLLNHAQTILEFCRNSIH
jgi:HEPN domain-containing protein